MAGHCRLSLAELSWVDINSKRVEIEMKCSASVLVLVALILPVFAHAQVKQTVPPVGTKLEFQGCPIRKNIEGGCWTVNYQGVTYDISAASGKPKANFFNRIRGTVSDRVGICQTAVILNPVSVTPTPHRCLLAK
jgi:hypothetical protein